MQILHNTFSKYRPTRVYNLDVIISVGYRVHSQEGVFFRKWATSVLKEYLIKGYAVRSDLAQQKYEDLKALVEVVGRTMGYLEGPKNIFSEGELDPSLVCAKFAHTREYGQYCVSAKGKK